MPSVDEKLDAISQLHSPMRIFGECGHDYHVAADPPNVIWVDEVGFTCEYLYSICHSCCGDNGEGQREGCVEGHEHWKPGTPICATRAIIDG